MSNWKVSLEKIELLPHPNADALEIGKLGTFQVVVQKGLYKNDDVICFAPEKAVLPDSIKEPWEKYLSGPGKNRVKAIRLRGEFSCGIIMPLDMIKFPAEIGEDISEKLGIVKYEPAIPVHLSGVVKRLPFEAALGFHDCEHFRTYAREFRPGERIIVTEKIHGSQFTCTYIDGNVYISSKGLIKNGLVLEESADNLYWQGFHNVGMREILADLSVKHPGGLRVFGEVFPCQKGFSYGAAKADIRIFDIRANGESIVHDELIKDERLAKIWAPVLYDGPLDEAKILELAEGKECVSGKGMHIKEGVVVAPYVDRRARDGTRLRLKVLNSKYKNDEEAVN